MSQPLSETSPAKPIDPSVDPHQLVANIDQIEAQLRALSDQLTQSQRLASIGTIAAVIAHEFNNLLTPVVSYAQFALNGIENGKPDDELIRKALTKTVQHANKAGKICTSMLALARGEGDTGPIEVQKLIDETLAVLARDPAKDGIALRVQVQPGLTVTGDAIQLEQVLLNLLINARQAMLNSGSRGGSITIKAEQVESSVRISVIDTGPGISEKNLPRIFDPFFTTKHATKPGQSRGTGLGLAISKQIVERHNGTLRAESTEGRGTTFVMEFAPRRAASNPIPQTI